MTFRKAIFCLTLMLFAHTVVAEEGMWLMDQIQMLNLQEEGLDLDTMELWNPDDGGVSRAVISLGGCTASFVSPTGLIATNHHCAYRAIQRNSTPENNLLEQGFLATTLQEELPTYGTNVYVLESFRDVTDAVLKGVKESTAPEKRHRIIETNQKKLIAAAEKASPDTRVKIAAMNYGQRYVLFQSLHIKDVRLVYAPASSIGKFGGDIDNFEWPRHTGDYTFLRAYVGPDGRPADPSPNNIPFQPERWLTVSTNGYQEGDFTMVIGYPGRTNRYRSSYNLEYYQEFYYPWRIDMLREYIGLLEDRMNEDEQAAVKLASLHSSLNNSLKNSEGQFDGLLRTDLLHNKREQEQAVIALLNAKPELQKTYGNVFPELEALFDDYTEFYPRLYVYYWMKIASSVIESAATIYTWSIEKEKDEIDRKDGYRDKDIAEIKNDWTNEFRTFDAASEQEALLLMFRLSQKLPRDQYLRTVAELAPKGDLLERMKTMRDSIRSMYSNTQLTSLEHRLSLLDVTTEELVALKDPAIEFVSRLLKELEPLEEQENEFKGTLSRLRPQFIKAEYQDAEIYPDANGTKRLNWGTVQGYSPADAVWYDYYTTTDGILEKFTGRDPFDSPMPLIEMIEQEKFGVLKDAITDKMHVDFLTTLDTTGGNSGSPVLNSKGELIGLLFDGNYESIVADWIFDERYTRSICVDIRYTLWIMSQLDHAQRLLNEMTIK